MALSSNEIKILSSLYLKKYRQKYNIFLAEGDKLTKELLRYDNFKLLTLYAHSSWLEPNKSSIPDNLPVIEVTNKELERISSLKSPQPCILKVQLPDTEDTKVDLNKGKHIYLDGLQNPGNIGSIIRIADWFGFDSVIRDGRTSDFFNPKVIQASMGSFTRVQLLDVGNENLDTSGTTWIGADMRGESIYDAALPQNGILVIGNEGQGISPEIKEKIEQFISIPPAEGSVTDSLNAAISTGIISALWSRT